jgi:hypothetical protein
MANKDLFKQAIAEAKSVREAAIANAKEALEETLTPHLKDMLAAKLQEQEEIEDTVVNETEEEVSEAPKEDSKDEAVEEDFTGVEEAEDEAEEDEMEAEDDSEESEDEAEPEIEDAVEGDEELSDLTVDQFKDMVRDIISQEIGGGEEEIGADMDGGDIEGMGDEAPIEEPIDDEPGADDEEIDLDELLAELEATVAEGEHEDKKDEAMHSKEKDETVEEETSNQVEAESDGKGHNVNRTGAVNEELTEALETIKTLQKDLHETNLLNSKLLYVNKIFKANNLSESQKVNIIAAFDKAETVKEVKLVFETVSENVVTTKKEAVSESKIKGMASKATGTTASTKPVGVISEVSDAVRRMQKLAGII